MSLYYKTNEILNKFDNETIYDLYACGYKLNLNGFPDTSQLTLLLGSVNNVIKIACGIFHSLAINNRGELYSWGYNDCGQLVLCDEEDRLEPTRVENESNWKEIACGGYHSLSINDLGELYAWGYNCDGELGLGDNENRLTPTRVGNNSN